MRSVRPPERARSARPPAGERGPVGLETARRRVRESLFASAAFDVLLFADEACAICFPTGAKKLLRRATARLSVKRLKERIAGRFGGVVFLFVGKRRNDGRANGALSLHEEYAHRESDDENSHGEHRGAGARCGFRFGLLRLRSARRGVELCSTVLDGPRCGGNWILLRGVQYLLQ